MKAAAALAILLVLVLSAYIEKRAYSCGAGLTPTQLGKDLEGDWFNGMFWIVDPEGWGVVAPPVDLQINDHETLRVSSIRRYAVREDSLAVELELLSGESAFVVLENTPTRPGTRIHRPEVEIADQLAAKHSKEFKWVNVQPTSCFLGLFWLARIGFLMAVALMLLAIRRFRKR